ncbi:TetR/AcrR family transcriptional regulator [Demequina aestuarii]|uniref:TetR/AcrR family transcriptional regulator n=1 Tax=Demequina aestuarii TaxID=327095 RepID=UPI000780EA95|nr:TetR/AcrR family transcriptional regulator [Demequina aestuarii]
MTPTPKATLTRDAILATGTELMRARGFTGVGLQEILSTCGVPKGSFYHYFSSKEGFGVAVLERYLETYLAAVHGLVQRQATGRDGVRSLAQAWADGVGEASADRCLVVTLSAEVSSFSEPMREQLERGVAQLVGLLATTVTAGYADGSIPERLPARALAEALYELWLGAALLDRVARTGSPFEAALTATDSLLT